VSKLPAIQVGQLSDVGGRSSNEDAIYACTHVDKDKLAAKGFLYAVADGTGGHEGGQTASKLALEVIGEHYYDNPSTNVAQSLREAVQAAQKTLLGLAESVRSWEKMSTTFVGVVFHKGNLFFANVGDSRAYLIRGDTITQKSVDHIWEGNDENHGQLIRWLGGGHPPEVEVEIARETLQEDDVVVLCSDGLSNVVHPDEIRALATRYDPQQTAKRLIDQANRRRSNDNVTATVVKVGEPTKGGGIGRGVIIGGLAAFLLALIAGAALLFGSGVLGGGEPTATPTITPQPTATPLPATATDTPLPPTGTATPIGTLDIADTATPTPTDTPVATDAPTAGPTSTLQPTDSPTPTSRPTRTPTHTPTHTPTFTPPAEPSETPVPTATPREPGEGGGNKPRPEH